MFIKKKAFNLFKKSATLRLKDKKFIVITEPIEQEKPEVKKPVVEHKVETFEPKAEETPVVAVKKPTKKTVKPEVEG